MPLLTLKCAPVILYRITLHPLARYPGPLLTKVTDAYAAYHGFYGDIHIDIWKCHAKYGTSYLLSLGLLLTNLELHRNIGSLWAKSCYEYLREPER